MSCSTIRIAWAAAWVDADGTIAIITTDKKYTVNITPVVEVTNLDFQILELLKEFFGGHISAKSTPAGSNIFAWRLNSHKFIEPFLTLAHPFLIVKKRQAKTLLEFIEYRKQFKNKRRELRKYTHVDFDYVLHVQSLNRR